MRFEGKGGDEKRVREWILVLSGFVLLMIQLTFRLATLFELNCQPRLFGY